MLPRIDDDVRLAENKRSAEPAIDRRFRADGNSKSRQVRTARARCGEGLKIETEKDGQHSERSISAKRSDFFVRSFIPVNLKLEARVLIPSHALK